jgi:hypothetical protein
MNYDGEKCLEMSQSISAIFDHADASLAEACSAIALACRTRLDNESDKYLRALMTVTLIKHLTMDHPKPAFELIKPNGTN